MESVQYYVDPPSLMNILPPLLLIYWKIMQKICGETAGERRGSGVVEVIHTSRDLSRQRKLMIFIKSTRVPSSYYDRLFIRVPSSYYDRLFNPELWGPGITVTKYFKPKD